MKTRIITGVVGIAIFVAAIITALCINTIILDILLMLVGAMGVYEALANTGYVKSKFLIISCILYAAVTPFALNGFIPVKAEGFAVLLGVLLFTVGMFKHKKVTPTEVTYAFACTVAVTYCFWSMAAIFESDDGHGLFYLMLLFLAAWACDTGAYFSGYFFGKHKMAPEISPQKTIEGAIGGVITAVLSTVVACFIFEAYTGGTARTLVVGLITPVLAFVGMMGDLVASYIKRAAGIKDYGNIMPGHGGILDRFDSVMMIAPLMYIIITISPLAV